MYHYERNFKRQKPFRNLLPNVIALVLVEFLKISASGAICEDGRIG
jgi:hypothetical protein